METAVAQAEAQASEGDNPPKKQQCPLDTCRGTTLERRQHLEHQDRGPIPTEWKLKLDTYRKLDPKEQHEDPMDFWRTRTHEAPGSVLHPLLQVAAAVMGVPATEAVCDSEEFQDSELLTSARRCWEIK